MFNEDYVDLMYRLARRDLALYLYDANSRPVRDLDGRIVVLGNRWGRTETASLSESEIRYLSVLDGATCVMSDPAIIPHQVTLFSAADLTLAGDTLHEARLVPLLRHDDFRDGLGWWTIVDSGANQGPSQWSTLGHPTLEGIGAAAAGSLVALAGAGDLGHVDAATDVVVLSTDTARASKTYRVLSVNNVAKTVTVDGNPVLSGGSSRWQLPGWGAALQSSNIWGGDVSPASGAKPGTMLIGRDAAWSDYRVVAQLRSADDDAIGVVVRYQGPGDFYRFSMDRERRYRRLVRSVAGIVTTLAEDDVAYLANVDYVITIEAVGSRLRVYQDDDLVFDVEDGVFATGRAGLYAWANIGARFSDVRIDDFGPAAPVAYRFPFTTSGFADFVHQVGSYEDQTWDASLAGAALAAAAAAAASPTDAASEAEARAFAALAGTVLGPAANQPAARTEVHRLSVEGHPSALLVRGPEPIDWKRTSVTLQHAEGRPAPVDAPGALKVLGVSLSAGPANDEAITILARDRADLAGQVIERYGFAGPVPDEVSSPLLEDDFELEGGVLLDQEFGPGALDRYAIYDAGGAMSGPSSWAAVSDAIEQTANIYAGAILGFEPDKLGTMAVTGSAWADTSTRAIVRSNDDDAIGLVIRFADAGNWYRLSIDHQRAYRRMVKCVDGTVSVLWEDHALYDTGRAYELRVDAVGDLLAGYVDDVLIFVVHDDGIAAGQVGLYCWANIGARFERLTVQSLSTSPFLLVAPLTEPSEIDVVDVTGPTAQDTPSNWTVAGGVASQASEISGDSPPPGIAAPGTIALIGPSLGDLELRVALTSSEPGALGVVFRYLDSDNWYRFAIDRANGYRRLVRCLGGTTVVLWQDSVAFDLDRLYELTLTVEGGRMRVRLDGELLTDLTDGRPSAGRVGLYCSRNGGASFTRLVLANPSRQVGAWTVYDETTIDAPSVWRSGYGSLRQNGEIGTDALPDALGSTAVGGSPSWADYRFEALARCDSGGAIGLELRRRDRANWYRFSADSTHSYRRLVKAVDGIVTTLWEDAHAYDAASSLRFRVDALGSRLVGMLGDEQLFDLEDTSHPSGAVGLYTSQAAGARFERAVVVTPPLDARAVFRDRFEGGSLAAWSVVDDGDQAGPSSWQVVARELRQTSNLYSDPVAGTAIERRGTYAHTLPVTFGDGVISARLVSDDDDAIGVMFRYVDPSNYYRFSMDRERSYRRLVVCTAGVFTTLWEDDVAYEIGRAYELAVPRWATASTRGWTACPSSSSSITPTPPAASASIAGATPALASRP